MQYCSFSTEMRQNLIKYVAEYVPFWGANVIWFRALKKFTETFGAISSDFKQGRPINISDIVVTLFWYLTVIPEHIALFE